MTYTDITRRLDINIALWPESRSFVLSDDMTLVNGDMVNLSSVEMNSHTGTHLDAPFHVFDNGAKAADVPIDTLVGPAQIVEITNIQEIDVSHLKNLDLTVAKRVLIKTAESFRPDHVWNEDFPCLTNEAAQFLVDNGVVLVGVDGPSVDPFGTDDLKIHKIILGSGAVILENLALAHVDPGPCELIALPLNLQADGSPIRAVIKRD